MKLSKGQLGFILFFVACLAVIVVASVLVLENRQDRPLRGRLVVVPVVLALDTTAGDWKADVEWAAKWWNEACDVQVFVETSTMGESGSVGVFLLSVDPKLGGDDKGLGDGRPHTVPKWQNGIEGGKIGWSEITLPPHVGPYVFPELRRRVIAHELGHGIGFWGPRPDQGHDDWEDSVMYSKAQAPNGSAGTFRVTEPDCADVKRAYAR